MQPQVPRRFWRITFWDSDGIERRRYIKCPYLVPATEGMKYRRPLVPGDSDYLDSFIGMTTALAVLEWAGRVTSYRVSPVPSERINNIRNRAVRWTTVVDELAA
jgi:hypothetical protein